MLDIWKEILKMHENKNMEIFYGHKSQQLNKLFKITLQESAVNPLLFVAYMTWKFAYFSSFMWAACAECAKHLLSLLWA